MIAMFYVYKTMHSPVFPQVLGEIELNGKCVNTLDTTRGGQLVAVGGMINSVTIGVIS